MFTVSVFKRSRGIVHASLYSRQAGVPSCRRQHVERPSAPHHICTVTRDLQTASQDFQLFSFLPGHLNMTYLFIIIIVYLILSKAFPVDLVIIDNGLFHFTFWICLLLRLSLSSKFGLRPKISQRVKSFFAFELSD